MNPGEQIQFSLWVLNQLLDPLLKEYFHLNELDKSPPFSEWILTDFFFEAVDGEGELSRDFTRKEALTPPPPTSQ